MEMTVYSLSWNINFNHQSEEHKKNQEKKKGGIKKVAVIIIQQEDCPHMHVSNTGTPFPLPLTSPLSPLSASEPDHELGCGGAISPSINSEFGSAIG